MSSTESKSGTHLVFKDSGDVVIFHDGKLDPREVGDEVIQSEKITEVDWDPEDGMWVSRLRDGTELCRRAVRSEVVEVEHQMLADMESRGEKMPSNGLWSAIKKTFIRKFTCQK